MKCGPLLNRLSSLCGERYACPFIYFFHAGSQIPSASFSLHVLYSQGASPVNPSPFPEHLPFEAASAHPGHTFKSLLCPKYLDLAKSFVFSYWEWLCFQQWLQIKFRPTTRSLCSESCAYFLQRHEEHGNQLTAFRDSFPNYGDFDSRPLSIF